MCKKRTTGGLAFRQCIAEQKQITEDSQRPHMRKTQPFGYINTNNEEAIKENSQYYEEQEKSSTNNEETTLNKNNNLWERPNILLITTDQQRRDTLGCYGDDEGVNFHHSFSPHIDQLAKEGIRFTQVLLFPRAILFEHFILAHI